MASSRSASALRSTAASSGRDTACPRRSSARQCPSSSPALTSLPWPAPGPGKPPPSSSPCFRSSGSTCRRPVSAPLFSPPPGTSLSRRSSSPRNSAGSLVGVIVYHFSAYSFCLTRRSDAREKMLFFSPK